VRQVGQLLRNINTYSVLLPKCPLATDEKAMCKFCGGIFYMT